MDKRNRQKLAVAAFRSRIWKHYRAARRDFPWRHSRDPYAILVSEIMLQQTQTDRVVPKYLAWLERFPDFKTLAAASRADVLAAWQGLGYNRRAIALQETARVIVRNHAGRLPRRLDSLLALPGIGAYTAGAILAFAFEEPAAIIETNIRRAFIHEFFPRRKKVADRELLPLIAVSVPRGRAREWYYAVMDYGAMLGQTLRAKNPNRRSANYAKQSQFRGSNRELRGRILAAVIAKKQARLAELAAATGRDLATVRTAAAALAKEGFLRLARDIVRAAV